MSTSLCRCRIRSAFPTSPLRYRVVVSPRRWTSTATTTPPAPKVVSQLTRTIYMGPLTTTFKYLKMFSLSSLALSTALSPFIFILESSLPFSGRVFLAITAISTTTLSTWLITTFTSPYVTRILAHPPSSPFSHTLTTTSLLLRPLHTKITSPSILVPSERPLTTWKLPEVVVGGTGGMGERTLAWTEKEGGERIGNWVVGDDGVARTEGKVAKNFYVHQQILAESMEVSPS